MLDFSFTDEQNQLRKTLREFSLKELLPNYAYWDKHEEYPYEPIKKVLEIVNPFGDDWRAAAESDDLIMPGIIAEEVARGDFNCVLPSLGAFTMGHFLRDASDGRAFEASRTLTRVKGVLWAEPSFINIHLETPGGPPDGRSLLSLPFSLIHEQKLESKFMDRRQSTVARSPEGNVWQVIVGSSTSVIMTSNPHVLVFPAPSVAVAMTGVVPTGKEPDGGS